MPYRFIYPTLLILLIFGSLPGTDVRAGSHEDALFFLSFDKGLAPEIAAGDKAPVLEGAPVFADGKAGKGLVTGKPGFFVTYASDGNLDPSRGALALWVKSLNWKLPDQQFHAFFQSAPFLALYSHKDGNPVWFWTSREGYNGPTAVAGWSAKWDEGAWHHLAATWEGSKMKFYFDGTPKGTTEAEFPLKAAKRFSIGPQHAWAYTGEPGKEPLSVIDEFKIFKRPLTDAEVRALFE